MTTDPTPLTDDEWRAFQAIPDQGYSHRGWVDRKIAQRVRKAQADALREAAREMVWDNDAERLDELADDIETED